MYIQHACLCTHTHAHSLSNVSTGWLQEHPSCCWQAAASLRTGGQRSEVRVGGKDRAQGFAHTVAYMRTHTCTQTHTMRLSLMLWSPPLQQNSVFSPRGRQSQNSTTFPLFSFICLLCPFLLSLPFILFFIYFPPHISFLFLYSSPSQASLPTSLLPSACLHPRFYLVPS